MRSSVCCCKSLEGKSRIRDLAPCHGLPKRLRRLERYTRAQHETTLSVLPEKNECCGRGAVLSGSQGSVTLGWKCDCAIFLNLPN